MWYNGRALSVAFERINDTKGDERRESVSFTTIGRNQKFFRDMLSEIRGKEESRKKEIVPTLFVWRKSWTEIEPYRPRSLDTVILPDSLKKALIKDIENFHKSEQWYIDMGIPYHRGYLFEGLAGTGKTSLVIGLSSYFKSRVCVLKISEMSDATLAEAAESLQPNSFVVMEDIDCVDVAGTRKKDDEDDEDKNKESSSQTKSSPFNVSLSGLLNVLDGILAPSGTLFFMTTNHVEKLDPALIRPGRVDFRRKFDYATSGQKTELYDRFFPGKVIPDSLLHRQLTMAELQQILMEQRQEEKW